jgi:hypothetical protein
MTSSPIWRLAISSRPDRAIVSSMSSTRASISPLLIGRFVAAIRIASTIFCRS